ncbi:BBE domain-containing protein [Rhodococcus sp. JVH1]|uniref:BBE domain-containing protein n=1 Tax=Rhodococcus sp. JVH1 TaxID=745408 RepID=UPI00192CE1F6
MARAARTTRAARHVAEADPPAPGKAVPELRQRPTPGTPRRRAPLFRLRDLKAKYDPDSVFRDNFRIAPERSAS